MYNIPPTQNSLPESIDTSAEQGLRYSENDFGNARYDGPQPPKGHGVHRYDFRLVALDVPNLTIPGAAGVKMMWDEANKHILAEATLTGTFEA